MRRRNIRLVGLAGTVGVVAGALALAAQALLGGGAAQGPWVVAAIAGIATLAGLLVAPLLSGPTGPGGPAPASSPPPGMAPARPRPGVLDLAALEPELARASAAGRPVSLILAGLDRTPGLDFEDGMDGLRQVTSAALRRQDTICDRDPASLLIMALDAPAAEGWIIAERIHQRATAARMGTVRLVVEEVASSRFQEVLEELDSGLEVCRATGEILGDPARMLARQS